MLIRLTDRRLFVFDLSTAVLVADLGFLSIGDETTFIFVFFCSFLFFFASLFLYRRNGKFSNLLILTNKFVKKVFH